jgi:adenylyltransferase/sulfurtransferase
MTLAAAGVGTLILVDFDRVDESNLQRQILFSTSDVGRPKVDAAADRLLAINPNVHLELVDAPFDVTNARRLVDAADIVIDGADNFSTRFLVNDACIMARRPNVFGSVSRFEGQVAVFAVPGGPCYRCLHPEPPPDGLIPSCAEGGVLGVVPGVIGALQATEAVKLITGAGEPLIGRMLLYDALRMRARAITLPRDPDCPVCGDHPSITELVESAPACATMATPGAEITVDELSEWQRAGRPHVLVDVREASEHAVEQIDGAVLVPLGVVFDHLDRFPRDRPVVVHCRTGHRSARAATQLRARGIDARSLVGGIVAWRRRSFAPEVRG